MSAAVYIALICWSLLLALAHEPVAALFVALAALVVALAWMTFGD